MTTTIIIKNLEGSIRTDKFLANQYCSISRTQIKKSFDHGLVMCNGDIIPPKYILKNDDILEFELLIPTELRVVPYDMPLDVLFEDEHLIVINKPAGIVVHPGNGTTEPTLVEGALSHCQLSAMGGAVRPGVVHRLDKYTTGAIIFAKSDKAYLKLVKMFAEHLIKKHYLAIVCGTFELLSGIIDKPIGRHKTIKTKMDIRADGRPACTDWSVVEHFGKKFTLLRIDLHTGRTHQIRVHLSSIGHPLLGDELYGYHTNFSEHIDAKYPFLHAQNLEFIHPITHQNMRISAAIPPEFEKMMEILRCTPNTN